MRRAPAADHVGARAWETGAGRASRGLAGTAAATGLDEAGVSASSRGTETASPDRTATEGAKLGSGLDASVAVLARSGTARVVGSGRTAPGSPVGAAEVAGCAAGAGRGSPRRSGRWPGSAWLDGAALTSVGETGAAADTGPAGDGRLVATGAAAAGTGAGITGRPTEVTPSRARAGARSSGVCSIGIAGAAGTAAVIDGTVGASGLESRLGSVAARQTGERLS